jgi:N-methylhydantoinase A
MQIPLRSGERIRLAIDTGGTFTDIVVERSGFRESAYKVPSTPSQPTEAFFHGLAAIAADLGLSVRDLLNHVGAVVHGTTITTNAFLTHNGVRTGLVTTAGLSDTILRPQGRRVRRFDSKIEEPELLVPRHLIRGIRGRVDRTGAELEPLNIEDLLAAAGLFRDEGVEAVAVCLIFSFINPAQERLAQEILERELEGLFVTRSSAIVREMRLFERTSTTVANAYVGPVLRRYLEQLRDQLVEEGYSGPVHLMQSNGGVITLQAAAALAVNSLLSGPAGGPPAATALCQPLGFEDLVMIDMGGTSFEVSLTLNGRVPLRRNGSLAGTPLITPMLEIETMGAGGGSIASVTPGNLLQVGPASAGAEPGPACYGRGGTQPTVTDASLILGYIDSDNFASGAVTLDRGLAEAALTPLAASLGLNLSETAAAIYGTVNAGMADGVRLAAVRRGVDVRSLTLIAGGGAGPIHAAALAEALDIEEIVIPADASVLCAGGMLQSELSRHSVRTVFRAAAITSEGLEKEYLEIEAELTAQLIVDGVSADDVLIERGVDLRYVGQVHEIEVVLPSNRAFERGLELEMRARFEALHLRHYGHVLEGAPMEPVNIRVRAWAGSTPRASLPDDSNSGGPRTIVREDPIAPGQVRTRVAWLGGGFTSVSVHDAHSLVSEVVGPALIELGTSTVVVPPGWLVSGAASSSTSDSTPPSAGPAAGGPLLLRRVSRQRSATSLEPVDSGGVR